MLQEKIMLDLHESSRPHPTKTGSNEVRIWLNDGNSNGRQIGRIHSAVEYCRNIQQVEYY